MLLKVLFGATWGTVALASAVRVICDGPPAFLSACARGLMWTDTGHRSKLGPSTHVLLWLFHAGGLVFLWRLSGQGYQRAIPLGFLSCLLLAAPQFPALCRGRLPDVTPLSALTVPYALVALRLVGLVPAATAQSLLPWFSIAAAGYALLLQVERAQLESRWHGRMPLALLLLLAPATVWVLAEYLGACTHGVTGSDPYCYVQMAVDLAKHGDLRHTYTLYPLVRDLGIPWWPIVHVGYYPPDAITGAAPTVWPVGWPVLLSAGYLLGGERALYWLTPLLGVLALIVTGCLVHEVLRSQGVRRRWLGVTLAILILATSREQVLQVLVPMADVACELLTALAMWLALRAGRRQSWAEAALGGVALGIAYDVRHTQVFLAPVLALALVARGPWRRNVHLVIAAGVACLLAALPDLAYHQWVFGSPWHPESPEMNLIGFQHWWPNAHRMIRAAASSAEFGLLLVPLGYGAWRLWRDDACASTVLVMWVAVNAGSQFLYGPLRWRDLLSVLPPLVILAAYGSVALIERVRTRRRLAAWAPGWLALALATLLAVRTGPMADWPLRKGEMNFGYLTAAQRQAFATLAASIEPDAVVGTALNSGAVDLYTGRETFRPGDWSEAELDLFLTAMAAVRKPVYVLDDGNEHAAVVDRLRQEGRLEFVNSLDVPLYGDAEELSGALYRVR